MKIKEIWRVLILEKFCNRVSLIVNLHRFFELDILEFYWDLDREKNYKISQLTIFIRIIIFDKRFLVWNVQEKFIRFYFLSFFWEKQNLLKIILLKLMSFFNCLIFQQQKKNFSIFLKLTEKAQNKKKKFEFFFWRKFLIFAFYDWTKSKFFIKS